MHRTKNSLSKPKTPRAKDNGNLANISVPYYPALAKPLRQISDCHNISLRFTSNRNLRNMLTKTKTQPPPHTTRNVIYQIPCKDCNAAYCGQTRHPLHLRLSEHQRFTNNSKSFTSTDLQYTSAVAHHAHTTGHTIDFKSTQKKCIRSLFRVKRISILCPGHTKSTFTAYKILTVHNLYFYSVLTSIFSSLYSCPPQPIVDQVKPHLSKRKEAYLNLPLVRPSNHHKNMPDVGLKLWNSFINVTSTLDKLSMFKFKYPLLRTRIR